jgi:hypothetical protein
MIEERESGRKRDRDYDSFLNSMFYSSEYLVETSR